MKKLNVGIVGYGWAAEAHLAAINATANGQVTAIGSSRPLDPAALSAKHRCPLEVCNRLDDLLQDRSVDIVDRCSYHDLHARQTIAAARAGTHLIIWHTHLVGSEGSLLDNRFHSNRLHGLSRHAWSQLSFKPVDSGDVSDHPYQTQFQVFFDALLRGEDLPHTTLADAARTHEIIFAADRSAQTGRPVKL